MGLRMPVRWPLLQRQGCSPPGPRCCGPAAAAALLWVPGKGAARWAVLHLPGRVTPEFRVCRAGLGAQSLACGQRAHPSRGGGSWAAVLL